MTRYDLQMGAVVMAIVAILLGVMIAYDRLML